MLAWINLAVLVLTIGWNYASQALRVGGHTIGEISARYANSFTPASYAFSIWGLIFLGLLTHATYQLYLVYSARRSDSVVRQLGPWLVLANLGNAAWVWCWIQTFTALSVVVMCFIAICLWMAIVRLNMERWDAPLSTIAFVWWPIAIYSGWICVALIANLSAYLAKIGWLRGPRDLIWTLSMIAVAVSINLLMVYFRNLREFAAVGVWALVAIAVRHRQDVRSLQLAATAGALVLVTTIASHAWKNRKTLPLMPKRSDL